MSCDLLMFIEVCNPQIDSMTPVSKNEGILSCSLNNTSYTYLNLAWKATFVSRECAGKHILKKNMQQCDFCKSGFNPFVFPCSVGDILQTMVIVCCCHGCLSFEEKMWSLASGKPHVHQPRWMTKGILRDGEQTPALINLNNTKWGCHWLSRCLEQPQ